MNSSAIQIKNFQNMIFYWWQQNHRDLPWRHTRDPYKIIVSEIMLQQTQVSRVLPKYSEFIETFQTVDELARASAADVLKLWKGMGYNRRALYLHQTAKVIVAHYHGIFPKEEKELVKLPGLGKYTARAILVFAYDQQVSMVDTNIRHIISHFFFSNKKPNERDIAYMADKILPKNKSWEWHQALMDYGALEMKKIKNHTKQTKLSIPFKDSRRFYRGLVVDKLRQGQYNEKTLLTDIKKEFKKPRVFLSSIIKSLEQDGLVSRTKTGIISLPE